MHVVERFMKVNILFLREMERRKIIKIITMDALTNHLGVHSQNCTYGYSVKILKDKINKVSNIPYLKSEINDIYEEIMSTSIKDFRWWNHMQTDLENELADLVLKRMLFMDNCMVDIKTISELLDIPTTTVKNACQQQRLLNTQKIGPIWRVHIYECRSYWKVPETNPNALYKDWEY